ncbi:SDR family oxidoreductase [Myxococcota bacterium]|nr:SDR family oxidoreductase [Myxococcota bacterium]
MTNQQNARPVAIVTGASSGIGEASARALAAAGFGVVLAARRADRLKALAEEIESKGGQALAVPADLAEEAATHGLVDQAMDRFGRVDVLLNNAGYSPAAANEQISRSALRHTFEVNLFSALQLAAEVSPIMRAQGSGRILNMGSLGGSVAAPLAIPYAGTKAGMEAVTRGLRLELAPFGIHVSLIVPGFIDTETFDNSRASSVHLREDSNNPYQQIMIDLDEFAAKQTQNALPPEAVGQVVVRAATETKPKMSYYAPASARFQSGFMGMLPEAWVHKILLRLYKLKSK